MNIGQTIKKIREQQTPPLSQTDFAKLLGVSQAYISKIEKGNTIPNISFLNEIAEEFKIPLPVIFWLSAEETDVAEKKRKVFKLVKPLIDSMIDTLLSNELD